jgi:rhodanese-related sulfurtransferase
VVVIVPLGACSKAPAAAHDRVRPGRGEAVPVESGGPYTGILPQDLNAMLKNKDFLLFNVDVPYEGEIERTDPSIPFDEVEAHLSESPRARDAKILVYCRGGSMRAIAVRALVKAGSGRAT